MDLDDDAVDRALRVWVEEGSVAYMARIRDYRLPNGSPDMVALRKADDEAERLNRDLMRRAINAALDEDTVEVPAVDDDE